MTENREYHALDAAMFAAAERRIAAERAETRITTTITSSHGVSAERDTARRWLPMPEARTT